MNELDCPIRPISPDDDNHYWFGYFDRTPYRPADADGSEPPRLLLAHRASFVDRFPEPTDQAELGVLDPDARSFRRIAECTAWNWQQGSHLQWLRDPAGEGKVRVIHNARRRIDGAPRPVAVIREEDGTEVRQLDAPIVSVSKDGRRAATLDLGRLTRLRREYGLPGIEDAHPSNPAPDVPCIEIIDLATGGRTPLMTMAELARAGVPEPVTHHQHVNHVLFNPSGTRVCFMHRFERDDGIMHSRLFAVGVDGSDLRLLFEGMCSHYDWVDDSTILAWAGQRALLGGASLSDKKSPVQHAMTVARKGLKPVYYALGKPRFLMNKIMKDSYRLIPDVPDSVSREFAKGELITDGHCTLSPKGRWVVTDGYYDMKFRQPLFLWDLEADRGTRIGRYPTPKELDGEIRVDLHPRFDRTGGKICIDSAMDGRRRMYEVDVSGLVG